jgi:uncharacterized protein
VTTDLEGAKAFYGAVFDWGAETADGEMPYTTWQVAGRPVAGMMAKPPMMPAEVPPHWGVYFMVANLDRALDVIRERGGQVRTDPIDTPAGRFAPAADPAGASFNPIQPPAG